MIYSIDRFEGEFAVLEHDGLFTDFLREKLPETAHEGDLLEWSDNGWQILHDDTENKRQALAERRRQMLEARES
ncbi:MAG: DUF3006 domain-containing protein [Oscillospiraceae bacterium]|nr:DUF3006 domain-containing protein [Oscillospiraceae bacterium]